jgi:hypothetical protein
MVTRFAQHVGTIVKAAEVETGSSELSGQRVSHG